MAKWKYQPSVEINSLMQHPGAFQIHSRRAVLAIIRSGRLSHHAPCKMGDGLFFYWDYSHYKIPEISHW
jgi:hypothetical protein